MMKRRIIAVILTLVMTASLGTQAFAESEQNAGYSSFAHIVDSVFGVLHDAVFSILVNLTREKNIPDYEEFISQNHEYFYKGTDGRVKGDGWTAGFASGSIIPEKWRCDAQGNSDPNGHCLKIIRATGGYQTFVSKLYTDQMMNMLILSNGSDSNGNGINDMLIFISADGVGMTADTCNIVRASVLKALEKFGVTAQDILSCNVSATHCHAGLDIQGMSVPTLFLNKLNPFTDYNRSLNRDMMESIREQAFECAEDAYGKLEKGNLYFFETGKTSGANDKLNSGANTKDYFSCFLFYGKSGEKTLLTNIGAHPTSYGAWDNNQMMCADYPYFMSLALKDAGFNLVFTQSAEASVSSPSIDYEEGDENDRKASRWVEGYALSKEEWVERYGKKYADKHYDSLEKSLEGHMKKGFLLADFIISSIDRSAPISPVLNVKNSQTLLGFDYGVMSMGSVSGLLGENVVKTDTSESGYGIVVETNYLEIGENIAILTAPGELSPTLVFGSDPEYDGASLWNGETSWAGREWQYDTLENIVREKTGDSDKKVLLFGVTNDALGYIFPDVCTTQSLLGTLIFYKENPGDMTNCMLMTVGAGCASELMDGYIRVLEK